MYRFLQFTIFLLFVYGCKSQKNAVTNIENNPSKEAVALDKKMNILFIPVDDLNHWVTYFGRNIQCKTPNLDRLSAMGVSFTNAHCAAPACCPSRAALMSGIRPSTSGVYDNADDWRKGIPVEKTMFTHFKNNGYKILGGGKIYHGGFDRMEEFDYFFEGGINQANRNVIKKGEFGGIKWAELDADDDVLMDYHVANWAAAELCKKHEKPFFLAAGIFRPHMPWNVPKKYFDMFPIESINLPPYNPNDLDDLPTEGVDMANPNQDHKKLSGESQWKEAIRAYLACIAYADVQIGRILDAYEKSPEREKTMILLWGDHGWHLGEKHHWRKFSLWEEATRSPFIWVVPGLTPKGALCNRPVDFLSVFPTLAEINGLPVPAHVEGTNILKLLKNPKAVWNTPALITFKEGNHAVKTDKFRYIRYAKGGEELYDVFNDPYEWNNIISAKEHQHVVNELKKYLPKKEKTAVGKDAGTNSKD
jgi:arylsulfatase A-like enzyme